MHQVKLIAPAKVNLVLAVGGVREDRYHTVDTVIHALALHDTIVMRRAEFDGAGGEGLEVSLETEVFGGVGELSIPAEENIVYRAVFLLAEALGRDKPEHIHVTLTKRIPHQAGLGGGSADAAAALMGAALLWGVDLGDERIHEVAVHLGVDVAFFLHGGCVYLTGKGECPDHRLAPRKDFVVLIHPNEGISTKEAYAAFDEAPCFPAPDFVASLSHLVSADDVEPWNNLQEAAACLVPTLNEVYDLLATSEGVRSWVLCGSGSAVCGFCDSFDAARAVSVEAHKRNWWSRVTSLADMGACVLEAH